MGYTIPTVKSKHYDKFMDKIPSCASKIYAITGTSTGLGFIAAKSLVSKGAHVLALNRKSQRATAASQQIRDMCAGEGTGEVTDVECDLQSFESVRAAGEAVLQMLDGSGLDALVCNAGVMALPDQATQDGYDVQMQTNHLSHFLLTSILMPALQTAASNSGSARVVMHTSGARKTPGTPCKAEYLGKNVGSLGGHGGRWERYHQTKLANVLFACALKDKLAERGVTNILCVSAAPGLAASNLQATTSDHGGGLGMNFIMKFSQSVEDGALPLLQCTAGADVSSGDLFVPGDRGPLSWVFRDGVTGWPTKRVPEALCTSDEGKTILWAESEKAVGPFFP